MSPRVALRERLLELLGEGSTLRGKIDAEAQVLHRAADCQMHVPARINDYTDFYVGIEHAQNVGKLFRPDNPLLPNYKYVPIGYHGRASTIRASGADVRRPKGQTLPAGQTEPTFGPCARLDYELELGIWIGQGNAMGDADCHRRCRRAHRRLLPAQRLVRAGHSGLGIPAAGAVPVEELHHQRSRPGSSRPKRWSRSARRNPRARRAILNRCRTCWISVIRPPVRWISNWKCC